MSAISKPPRMTPEVCVATINTFYPELSKVINDEITNSNIVHLINYKDYNINGFDKTYIGNLHLLANIKLSSDHDRFLGRVINVSEYRKSDYYQDFEFINYIDLIKHLSDNKEKHMYWFL